MLAPKCDRSLKTKASVKRVIRRLTLRQVNVITIRILIPTVSTYRSVIYGDVFLWKTSVSITSKCYVTFVTLIWNMKKWGKKLIFFFFEKKKKDWEKWGRKWGVKWQLEHLYVVKVFFQLLLGTQTSIVDMFLKWNLNPSNYTKWQVDDEL